MTESFDGKRVPIDSDLRISGKYPYYGATGIIDYVDDYIFNGEYVLLAEDGANIIMRNYPVAYLTQGKFWLNNHAHIMRMRNGSNYFLVQVLEKIDYKKYNTGTAQPKLNSKIVKNIELKIPHIEEQQQIGNFFKQLDDIIALHQRKLDLLKETKKGFLQKMFPKNGAKVPEIRFPGFTEDWEERKWYDTVNMSTDMVDPKEGEYDDLPHIGPENIESFTGRILNNVNTVREDNLISGKFHFNSGDIIYGKINPQLAKYAYVNFEGLTSADTYVLKSHNGIIQDFLFVILQTKDFYKYSVSVSMRTGMPKINRDELNQYNYLSPSNIDEQRKIGSFFNQLDNTITLHQRKLDLLKETKKGFLQKMFV
ncbi:restriction endonuclease subunit S [Enterococcus faecium]|uniref:restriction endonuclease subunit S n=1 Tax=Enterococcus faecium TaxID=1352 RepID=UPI0037701F84